MLILWGWAFQRYPKLGTALKDWGTEAGVFWMVRSSDMVGH